nr:hypothetical protein [Tanacetum cinerariifolium]
MAYISSCSSSSLSSRSEVTTCSKACLKSYETLKAHYDKLSVDYKKYQLNVAAYKTGLESVEARLVVYQTNETVFEKDIKILKINVMLRDNALAELRKKCEKAKKERDDLKLTLEKFQNSSKNLSKLLESQVSDKVKTGVGFDSQVFYYQELDGQESNSQVTDSQENDRYKTSEGYHVVPPPYTRNFMPLKPDLVIADIDEHVICESKVSKPEDKTSKTDTNVLKLKSVNEPIIEEWESNSDEENEMEGFSEVIVEKKKEKPSFAKLEFIKSNMQVKPSRESVKKKRSISKCVKPRKTQKPRRAKRGQDIEIPQSSGPFKKVGDEDIYIGEDDRVVRVATTATSLEVEQESGNINKTQYTTTLNEPSPQGIGSSSGPRRKSLDKENVSKQGRYLKTRPMFEESDFDNIDDMVDEDND